MQRRRDSYIETSYTGVGAFSSSPAPNKNALVAASVIGNALKNNNNNPVGLNIPKIQGPKANKFVRAASITNDTSRRNSLNVRSNSNLPDNYISISRANSINTLNARNMSLTSAMSKNRLSSQKSVPNLKGRRSVSDFSNSNSLNRNSTNQIPVYYKQVPKTIKKYVPSANGLVAVEVPNPAYVEHSQQFYHSSSQLNSSKPNHSQRTQSFRRSVSINNIPSNLSRTQSFKQQQKRSSRVNSVNFTDNQYLPSSPIRNKNNISHSPSKSKKSLRSINKNVRKETKVLSNGTKVVSTTVEEFIDDDSDDAYDEGFDDAYDDFDDVHNKNVDMSITLDEDQYNDQSDDQFEANTEILDNIEDEYIHYKEPIDERHVYKNRAKYNHLQPSYETVNINNKNNKKNNISRNNIITKKNQEINTNQNNYDVQETEEVKADDCNEFNENSSSLNSRNSKKTFSIRDKNHSIDNRNNLDLNKLQHTQRNEDELDEVIDEIESDRKYEDKVKSVISKNEEIERLEREMAFESTDQPVEDPVILEDLNSAGIAKDFDNKTKTPIGFPIAINNNNNNIQHSGLFSHGVLTNQSKTNKDTSEFDEFSESDLEPAIEQDYNTIHDDYTDIEKDQANLNESSNNNYESFHENLADVEEMPEIDEDEEPDDDEYYEEQEEEDYINDIDEGTDEIENFSTRDLTLPNEDEQYTEEEMLAAQKKLDELVKQKEQEMIRKMISNGDISKDFILDSSFISAYNDSNKIDVSETEPVSKELPIDSIKKENVNERNEEGELHNESEEKSQLDEKSEPLIKDKNFHVYGEPPLSDKDNYLIQKEVLVENMEEEVNPETEEPQAVQKETDSIYCEPKVEIEEEKLAEKIDKPLESIPDVSYPIKDNQFQNEQPVYEENFVGVISEHPQSFEEQEEEVYADTASEQNQSIHEEVNQSPKSVNREDENDADINSFYSEHTNIIPEEDEDDEISEEGEKVETYFGDHYLPNQDISKSEQASEKNANRNVVSPMHSSTNNFIIKTKSSQTDASTDNSDAELVFHTLSKEPSNEENGLQQLVMSNIESGDKFYTPPLTPIVPVSNRNSYTSDRLDSPAETLQPSIRSFKRSESPESSMINNEESKKATDIHRNKSMAQHLRPTFGSSVDSSNRSPQTSPEKINTSSSVSNSITGVGPLNGFSVRSGKSVQSAGSGKKNIAVLNISEDFISNDDDSSVQGHDESISDNEGYEYDKDNEDNEVFNDVNDELHNLEVPKREASMQAKIDMAEKRKTMESDSYDIDNNNNHDDNANSYSSSSNDQIRPTPSVPDDALQQNNSITNNTINRRKSVLKNSITNNRSSMYVSNGQNDSDAYLSLATAQNTKRNAMASAAYGTAPYTTRRQSINNVQDLNIVSRSRSGSATCNTNGNAGTGYAPLAAAAKAAQRHSVQPGVMVYGVGSGLEKTEKKSMRNSTIGIPSRETDNLNIGGVKAPNPKVEEAKRRILQNRPGSKRAKELYELAKSRPPIKSDQLAALDDSMIRRSSFEKTNDLSDRNNNIKNTKMASKSLRDIAGIDYEHYEAKKANRGFKSRFHNDHSDTDLPLPPVQPPAVSDINYSNSSMNFSSSPNTLNIGDGSSQVPDSSAEKGKSGFKLKFSGLSRKKSKAAMNAPAFSAPVDNTNLQTDVSYSSQNLQSQNTKPSLSFFSGLHSGRTEEKELSNKVPRSESKFERFFSEQHGPRRNFSAASAATTETVNTTNTVVMNQEEGKKKKGFRFKKMFGDH